MKKTELLQEVRKMRFEEAYDGWKKRKIDTGGGQQGFLEYAIALIDDIWLDMTSRGWRGL